ncbi:MAG TPA: phosphoribosylformylglycinamidine synthase subunit PurQ, partial [Bacillota bacterium]|nr:phosphoribosylformylglycinamidine synthase subunit PurQ [Bacillota bacterium]
NSPWLSSFAIGDIFTVPFSHSEGKLVLSKDQAEVLFEKGQVAFQYADFEGNPPMTSPMNPSGSEYAIEGIVSSDGLVLGKMCYSERLDDNLYKNIPGTKHQDIFANAVRYFQGK